MLHDGLATMYELEVFMLIDFSSCKVTNQRFKDVHLQMQTQVGKQSQKFTVYIQANL
jgi:hypothetical protein